MCKHCSVLRMCKCSQSLLLTETKGAHILCLEQHESTSAYRSSGVKCLLNKDYLLKHRSKKKVLLKRHNLGFHLLNQDAHYDMSLWAYKSKMSVTEPRVNLLKLVFIENKVCVFSWSLNQKLFKENDC